MKGLQFHGIRQEVIRILKEAIFDGVYEPGEQIYEANLAKKLNLSRGPIREALLHLETQSLVQNIHNRGWFVTQLTAEQISEITNLRVVLEVLALRLAKANTSDRQVSRLRKFQKAMLESYDARKYDEAIKGDFEFHQQIWQMAAHGVLERALIKVTTPYFAFFRMSKVRNQLLEVEALREGLENHEQMIAFLADETNRSAEWCIRKHFQPTLIKDWDSFLNLIHKEPSNDD